MNRAPPHFAFPSAVPEGAEPRSSMATGRPAGLARTMLHRQTVRLRTAGRAPSAGDSRQHSSGHPKEFSEIPGPKPLPLIGNIWRYFPVVGEFDISRFHVNFERMLKSYGPLVKEFVFGSRTVVHVFEPSDMETVFRYEGRFPSRCSHRALLQYRLDRPDLYNGGGLFPSNGQEWYRFRMAFQQHLLQPQNVNSYCKQLADVAADLVTKVRALRDPRGEVDDFQPDLYKWSTECTGFLALNRRLGCLDTNLGEDSDANCLIRAASDTHDTVMTTENRMPLWRLFPTPTYRKLVAAQDTMARIIKGYLDSAVTAMETSPPTEKTMLQHFLAIPDMDLKDVFTMIVDLFLAGIDTTANSVGFTLYHLARNPETQDMLRKELLGVLPSPESTITSATFHQTHFLKACVKESMRLNPVAIGSGRVLAQDVVLSNYKVPEGTLVITQNQVACRQECNFPDARAFRPHRWLKGDAGAPRVHPFLLLPFGYGPRMCIGRRFANLEMYVLLAELIRNFRVECDIEDLDCITRLINVPDQPLKLRFLDVST